MTGVWKRLCWEGGTATPVWLSCLLPPLITSLGAVLALMFLFLGQLSLMSGCHQLQNLMFLICVSDSPLACIWHISVAYFVRFYLLLYLCPPLWVVISNHCATCFSDWPSNRNSADGWLWPLTTFHLTSDYVKVHKHCWRSAWSHRQTTWFESLREERMRQGFRGLWKVSGGQKRWGIAILFMFFISV